MSDIITPVEIAEVDKSDTIPDQKQEQQFIVIFHSVAKGESLRQLSTKYSVTSEQIIEWNDLPKKTNPNNPLTVGMQLMIYQPKK